jgi:hypothetical protein
VTNLIKFTYRIRWAILIVFLLSGVCLGAERDNAVSVESVIPPAPESIDETSLPDEPEPLPAKAETHKVVNIYSGYRFFSLNGAGGRAAEYEYLHSNPDLAGMYNYLGPDTKFSFEGGYLNDKDYHGELVYDHKGIYRFDLRTESLFHNLDHEQLFSPGFALGGNSYLPDDRDPGALYGIRVEQNQARFRYKFNRLPVHLNLGYWRMVKEGTAQLRFSDHAFEGTPNTIYAETRGINNQTHEGRVGLDSHLGLFDLTYNFLIREFRDQAAIPADVSYIARPAPIPGPGGIFQHNENPDSRFYSHKIGLHTSMSGGLVGAISYAYGKRQNLSTLADVSGANQVSDTTQTIAGDLSYTPCTYFSLAVKYRRYDVDRDTPAAIFYAPGTSQVVPVRQAIDTRKNTVTATAIYHPVALLTLKGEYKGDYLSRDNLGSWIEPGRIATQTYPENSTTHTGSLTLLSRPLKGVRAKLQYNYTNSDNPAYANLPEEKHEGSFLIGYNTTSNWGVTASTRISRASSNHATITTIVPDPAIPVNPANTTTYRMPKNTGVTHATISAWIVPIKRLTLSGSYGLLRKSSDQEVLFAGIQSGSIAAANYTQQAQIFAVNGVYHHDERLDLSLGLQQVRSTADFDPSYISFITGTNSVNDTGDVRDITQLKTIESSLAARADYHLTSNVTCTLEYTFRDYDDKYQALFNGSVNTVTIYLAAKW